MIYGFMFPAKFLREEFRRLPQLPVGGLIFTVGGDVGRAGGLGGMCRPKGLLGGGEIWARVGVGWGMGGLWGGDAEVGSNKCCWIYLFDLSW